MLWLVQLLLLQLAVQAQEKQITGKVVNEKGEPAQGVSVTIRGTTRGTSTDATGTFTLSASPSAVLEISLTGYQSQRITVGSGAALNIQLAPSNKELDQVVVVGYGTQRKRDVTGSVVSVNEKALREVPVSNLQGALQGRAAGLEVQSTGTKPGAGAVIRIRGERSINGSNDPLLVLDGIPFEGGNINDINPDDVASVEVLKDASSTAIYGSRGSNGVLLITTKRGRTGEAKLSYNGYYGLSSVRTKYKVFNAQEYQTLRGLSTYTGGYMPEEKASIAAGRSTNWQDLMYQNGYTTDQNLGISGGANGSSYSLGGGYYKQTAVLPGQDFTRYSLRATIDTKVGKRLKVGLNTMNTVNVTNGSQFVDPMFPLLTLSPLMPAYDSTGKLLLSPTGNTDDRVGPIQSLVSEAQ